MDKIEEVGCDFKGSCGNRLANGCCSNVPSLSCSWQKPQPDQSGLLTDEEIRRLGRPQLHLMPLMKSIAEAQRDLTASIKDAEIEELTAQIRRAISKIGILNKRITRDEAEYQQERGRIIEWLLEDCDCPRNDFPTEQPSRPRHKCWKCMQKLKATHTSKKE